MYNWQSFREIKKRCLDFIIDLFSSMSSFSVSLHIRYPSQFEWLDQVKDILIQRAASKEPILMRKKYFAHTMRLVIIIPSRDAQLLFRRACLRKYETGIKAWCVTELWIRWTAIKVPRGRRCKTRTSTFAAGFLGQGDTLLCRNGIPVCWNRE